MPEFSVSAIDFTVAATYILIVMGIGIWVSRSQTDSKSYLSSGGVLWPIIGISMMSANLSGTSFVGIAGAGYDHGIAVWNYEWTATLVLIFFSLFVLPFYLRSKVSTMPEFLERRYDTRSRKVFAAFSVFTAVVIDSAGALFAGSLTLQLLFPEVPLWMLIASVAFLGGIYVIFGGLKAVMVTDTIQGVLLILVGTVIFFMTFAQIGSWEGVRAAAPDAAFPLRRRRMTISSRGPVSLPARSGSASIIGPQIRSSCKRCWRPRISIMAAGVFCWRRGCNCRSCSSS